MTQTASKSLTPRAVAGAVLQFSVSIVLIVWAVGQVDLSIVESRLKDLGWLPAILAFLSVLAQAAAAAWRWRRINARLDIVQGYAWHWRIVMVSAFFAQLLPSTLGGDAYRIWTVARGSARGFSAAIVSIICDRAIGLACILALIALTLPLTAWMIGAGEAFWSLSVLVLGGLAVFGSLVAYGKVPFGLSWLRIADALMAPAVALKRILSAPREFVLQFVTGVMIHAVSIVTMLLIAIAVAVRLDPVEAITLVPPVILFSMLPISIAGWGLREGAMIAAFAMIGRPAGDAVLLSVTFGLMYFGAGLIGGVIWGVFRAPARRTGDVV
ncbi:MAG: lysylphosphatidylglycerol synthase transmembrane domain-containing protein [Alphaproteobacteria bacterium]